MWMREDEEAKHGEGGIEMERTESTKKKKIKLRRGRMRKQ